MKAEIDAGGRKVSIECPDANVSPRELLLQVAAVWSQTDAAKGFEGSGIGFHASGATTPPQSRWMNRGAPLPVAEGVEP